MSDVKDVKKTHPGAQVFATEAEAGAKNEKDFYGPGGSRKELFEIPRERTVQGSEINVVVNGESWSGPRYMTFDEKENVVSLIRHRHRVDQASATGAKGLLGQTDFSFRV